MPADVTQSNNVTTFTTIQLGEVPKQLFCPSCKANILTKIKYEKGILAWLVCVGICVFGYALLVNFNKKINAYKYSLLKGRMWMLFNSILHR